MKTSLLLALFGLMAIPLSGHAQSRGTDLSQTSIEDLMNIEITSAARKEQRAGDAAASVFVITHDDIRRSGMATIPDVLRLAPGVDVAQINSNKWAVSLRGFNGLYANKVLVLIDGRSVYNRLFSGVLWGAQDLLLDDIDRIEVIRGPGAALWGANAVNGVINIVTRTAADTQGALVRVDGGRSGEQGAVRYGGTAGAARYRLYAQWTGRDQSLIAPGTRADDASHSVTTGFRADWTTEPGAFTLEGDLTAGQARALWPNLDPQTAARERSFGRTGRPSPGSLDSSTREWRIAADTVVPRHREPAGNGRELSPACVWCRHAIPHGSRHASGSRCRRRLPVHRREVRWPRRFLADAGGTQLVAPDRVHAGRD